MVDYFNEFPIPKEVLPEKLLGLLSTIGEAPDLRVAATTRVEIDQFGPDREIVYMVMAVVHAPSTLTLKDISETANGVVYQSTPYVTEGGGLSSFEISVSGHDYIVASNGTGGFYGFQLAEKVWISLGLTPRAAGGKDQKLYYDDLGAPEFGIAEGEISTRYYFSSERDVQWTILNSYLRRYLWMRGAHGVRVFHYQKQFENLPELRAVMGGQAHFVSNPEDGWYKLDIREFRGGLLVQVWAAVAAVPPELCKQPDAEELEWPGVQGAMTYDRANDLVHGGYVYLDDRFLSRYEQNSVYSAMPVGNGETWFCSPSYRGEWGFRECVRVGRNLIRTSIRDLYQGVPDREIIHAHSHLVAPDKAKEFDLAEEHVVAKTDHLVSALLDLGDGLQTLAESVDIDKTAPDLVHLSRTEIRNNLWSNYPDLRRIAQVAPLNMTEQDFLSRCKSIHELWQRIPNGFLKSLLEKCGFDCNAISNLGSIKLLQLLINALERLNKDGESLNAFMGSADPADLSLRNENVAPLFVLNDLRLADAHHAGEALEHLETLGFDIARVNEGYGRALDYVFDRVIEAFEYIQAQIHDLSTT